jgi:hypothetical protein
MKLFNLLDILSNLFSRSSSGFFRKAHFARCLFCFLGLLTGCGYHFSDRNQEKTTISLPLIKGDVDGNFMNAIVHELASSGRFAFQRGESHLLLSIAILSDSDDRIGYRYDRDPNSGKRRKNIVGIENRETIQAEVKVIDTYTQETIFGPQVVSASTDYDYIDSHSSRDLIYLSPTGPTTVIDFSLGQLDSIEGAHDDARLPIFHKLAQTIVELLDMQLKKNYE